MVAAGLIAALIAGAPVGVALVIRPSPGKARATPTPSAESSAAVIPVQDGVWEQGMDGLDYYDNSSGPPLSSPGGPGTPGALALENFPLP